MHATNREKQVKTYAVGWVPNNPKLTAPVVLQDQTLRPLSQTCPLGDKFLQFINCRGVHEHTHWQTHSMHSGSHIIPLL